MLNFSSVSTASTGTGYFGTILMILPIIVFSFNHSPMISSFVVKQRATYGSMLLMLNVRKYKKFVIL